MFNITIIKDTKNRPLTKVYDYVDDQLKPNKIPLSSTYHWREERVNSLEYLANDLASNISASQAILQGQVKKESRSLRKINRRFKDYDDRRRPDVEYRSTSLLCLDVDKYRDYDKSLTDQAIVEHFITNNLPSEFHNSSYVYQLSSSYKVIEDKGLCVHIFFHLDKAMTLQQQKNYVSSMSCEYLDLSIYSPSSIIYVAPPIFKGYASIFNPLHGSGDDDEFKRVNYITKQNEHITPPSIAYSEVKSTKIMHKPRAKAIDYDGSDKGAESLCHEAMSELRSTGDNRNRATFRKAVTLGRLIAAGRLDQQYAYDQFISACMANGFYQKRGEKYCKQQFDKGVLEGAKSPYYKKDLLAPKAEYKKPLANDYKPHTTDEINAITDMLMNRAIDNARIDHPYIAKVATGAGKTWKALHKAVELIKDGVTVLFAMPNYHMMSEAQELLQSIDSSLEPVLIVGRTRNCQLYQDANDATKQNYDEILEERSIPNFCKIANKGEACPFIDSCENREAPIYNLDSQLALTTHAKLSSLPDLPDNTLCFIDESPQLVYCDDTNVNLLKPLISTPLDKDNKTSEQRFRNEYRCISDLADYTLKVAHNLMKSHKGRTSDMLLLDALTRSNKDYAIELAEAVVKANDEGITVPNVNIKKLFITNGKTENKLTRKSVNLIVNIAKVILNQYEHNARIAYHNDKASIEIRYIFKMPNCKTIILDATPQAKLWKAYCDNLNLELTIDESTQIKAPISTGHFIKTGVFQTSQLFDEHGSLTTRAINSLNAANLSSPTIQALNNLKSNSLAIGTHKKLLDVLQHAQHDERLKDCELVKSLSKFSTTWGYTGKHDKGVNMFNACDSILILGTPKPNLRGLKADFKAIDSKLSGELQSELYLEASQAILTQWIGRLRGIRRGGLNYVYVGRDAPPNILGINWNHHKITQGRKSKDIASMTDKIEASLKDGRALSINDIVSMFRGCTRYLAKKIINNIAKRLQLSIEPIRNGIKLYSATCVKKCTNHIKQVLTGNLSTCENKCSKSDKAIEGGESVKHRKQGEQYIYNNRSNYFHRWQGAIKGSANKTNVTQMSAYVRPSQAVTFDSSKLQYAHGHTLSSHTGAYL